MQYDVLENKEKDELVITSGLIKVVFVISEGPRRRISLLPWPWAHPEVGNASRNQEFAQGAAWRDGHDTRNEQQIGYLSLIFSQRGVGGWKEKSE